jgi:phosphoglycolate phosphatase
MSKGKNNLLLMEREGLKNPVYVGDTQGDMNSAIEADIPFVFCRFGFGTVECEHNIDKLSELPALLKEI